MNTYWMVKRHVNEPHDAMKLVPLGVFMSLPASPHQHDIILHFSCNHWCAIKNSFWINWVTAIYLIKYFISTFYSQFAQ